MVGCSRQVVGHFLRREPVAARFFQEICAELSLPWEEIADLAGENQSSVQDVDLNELVQTVREKVSASIQHRCGTMKVLHMKEPITIDSVYTSVNILERISHNQQRTIRELLDESDTHNFDRFILGNVQTERIPAIRAVENYDKLMVLGKPGAGKTTFLRWLALQCSEGKVFEGRIPFFIELKMFAEMEEKPDLLSFIVRQLTDSEIENGRQVAERILHAGRAIVLLDGLDEVRDQDHDRIFNTIRQTEEKFHANKFVITCRIAAKEYTFDKFTDVEVTDFNDDQIVNFSRNWFKTDPIKAERFPEELKSSPSLQELAINPLLLTLLCLVFEAGGRFPTNRSELYKEGLDILLKKWDADRNIQRKGLYGQLSLRRKEDLLSQIAYNTFERSDYFFKQNFVEEQIQEYIQNFPFANTDQKTLEVDSENVLKEIAAHHGLLVERAKRIYSFSHLTFQEYFTACFIKEKANGDFGDILICHITNKQWREVFLMTVGMLSNADKLLQGMKQEIDNLPIQNNRLQRFLEWVEEKSKLTNKKCSSPQSVGGSDRPQSLAQQQTNSESDFKLLYKMSAIRAFYLAEAHTHPLTYVHVHPLDFALDLAHTLDSDFKYDLARTIALSYADARIGSLARSHASVFALDLVLSHALVNALSLSNNSTFELIAVKALNLDPALALEMESTDLSRSLQQLKARLPDSFLENLNNFQYWWRENGQEWSEQLRTIMTKHRDIGHNWQFSEDTLKLIQQYYDANKLLVDCLESDCYTSRDFRKEIEPTLLLPSR